MIPPLSTMDELTFTPPVWLRNAHLQSILSSLPPRRPSIERAAADLRRRSEDLIIDCGAGVRLLAHIAKPAGRANGRMVAMIHGWEGSADAGYVLSLAPRLLEEGYTVVRLNLRDHGDSHHLNEELFHSCRLAEVMGAMGWLQERYRDLRLSLVGFSLGGNFSLRIGADAGPAGLELDQIVAICPVLDPEQTMVALDNGWVAYRRYFLRKWRRSLLKKSVFFPHRYPFTKLPEFRTLEHMTDFFVTGYTEFDDLTTYLRGYAITGDRLAGLTADASLLIALDDPVIPAASLADMRVPPALTVHTSRYGGHCGFLYGLKEPSWVDDYVIERLKRGNE